MSLVTAFVNYALRFEQAYATDDWSIIEPCFTEDASYVVTGAPELRMDGTSTVQFRGTQIQRLTDHIPAESAERALRWMTEHAAKLGPPGA